MDPNPLTLDDATTTEFVTTASIGDIKDALEALDDDDRAAAAARVHQIEADRADEAPRKGLMTHLDELLDSPPPDPDGPGDTPTDDGDGPGAEPGEQANEPASSATAVTAVTVDRDCTLNLRGQTLKCKAGDVLTGEAAAYAAGAGAPVTEIVTATDDDPGND